MDTHMPPSSSTGPDAHSGSVTAAVVAAVADRRGVDPTALEPPLHDAIDTDALERLFEPTRRGARAGTVTFAYDGLSITVDSDGTVDVTERE